MTDRPEPHVQIVDSVMLEEIVSPGSHGPGIGWDGALPVTPETFEGWHLGKSPSGTPELWCARLNVAHDQASAVLWVDPALPVFRGHFPGNPILPGIVQLEWARMAAERVFPRLSNSLFTGLANIKFRTPVRPSSWLMVELRPSGGAILITIESAGRVCTQGRLMYGADPLVQSVRDNKA